jgi:hypothetical protein
MTMLYDMYIVVYYWGGTTVSRILIDLPEEDIKLLDAIKNIQNRSRAEIIRHAISGYLRDNRLDKAKNAFGAWQGQNGDGLTCQTALRGEWKE